MRTSSKLFGAAAVAGLVLVGGSAFTASNTVPQSVAGYGSATVTGATVTGIEHTLSADGVTITSSDLTFETAQTGRTVVAGFGETALEPCIVDSTDATKATCTYASPGYATDTALSFNVAVS